MKRVSRRELARAISRELLAGKDVHHLCQEVAAYLVEHKMTAQAGRLVQDVSAELQAHTGQASATVVTAFTPTQQSLDVLRTNLLKLTAAKEVELEVREDKAILGGVIVQLPGRELDASVRRKLRLLATGGVNG